MAHRSMWPTVCGIMLLCVAVPHASCHPRPDESQHEVMPYYQQAQEPEHYYPLYEEEGDKPTKERANLKDSDPSKEQKATNTEKPLYLTNRAKDVLDVTEVTSFPRLSLLNRSGRDAPEKLPASQDIFENFNTIEIPAEEHCRELMICEMRYLMTFVTPLENIIRTYGMHVPGLLPPGYQRALDDGSSRRPCKTTKKEGCPNNVLHMLHSFAKVVIGEHE